MEQDEEEEKEEITTTMPCFRAMEQCSTHWPRQYFFPVNKEEEEEREKVEEDEDKQQDEDKIKSTVQSSVAMKQSCTCGQIISFH